MNSFVVFLSGLVCCFVKEGYFFMEVVQIVVVEVWQVRVVLVYYLVVGGYVSVVVVVCFVVEEFGDFLIDLNIFFKEMMVKDIVDFKLIIKYIILLLLWWGSCLFVVVFDFINFLVLEEICFNIGFNVEMVIVEDDKLCCWIDQLELEYEGKVFDNLDDDLDNLESSGVDVDVFSIEDVVVGLDDVLIVRFVNKLLFDVIKGGVLDLYFEFYEKIYWVWFCQDGILEIVVKLLIIIVSKLVVCLKVMVWMDIFE